MRIRLTGPAYAEQRDERTIEGVYGIVALEAKVWDDEATILSLVGTGVFITVRKSGWFADPARPSEAWRHLRIAP